MVRQRRSTKTLSRQAPLPSMLIVALPLNLRHDAFGDIFALNYEIRLPSRLCFSRAAGRCDQPQQADVAPSRRRAREQPLHSRRCGSSRWCQRRVKNPQKCRSKFPHLHGSGDQPVSVICSSVFGVGRSPAPLWRRWWGDWGVGADMLGDEVSMAA